MAHKTLVNSTAYDITGGKTLVEGTSYSVKNGKVLIGGAAYDISFILPATALAMWSGYNTGVITCITHTNGYWVVCGYTEALSSGTDYARIAWATELDGTWSSKDLWGHSGSSDYTNRYPHANYVNYINGYWVVGGGRTNTNEKYDYARIAWSTSLGGTWTTKDIASTSDSTSNAYTEVKAIAMATDIG